MTGVDLHTAKLRLGLGAANVHWIEYLVFGICSLSNSMPKSSRLNRLLTNSLASMLFFTPSADWKLTSTNPCLILYPASRSLVTALSIDAPLFIESSTTITDNPFDVPSITSRCRCFLRFLRTIKPLISLPRSHAFCMMAVISGMPDVSTAASWYSSPSCAFKNSTANWLRICGSSIALRRSNAHAMLFPLRVYNL